MQLTRRSFVVCAACFTIAVSSGATSLFADEPRAVLPIAILPFQERGADVEDLGAKVSDLLFANLVSREDVYLVERQDLAKILQEQELTAAGLVDPKQSVALGRLTGAKVLVTGSVLQVGDSLYLVAKLMGVETTRVVGASAKGKVKSDLDALVQELAKDVAVKLERQAGQLVAKPTPHVDRVAALAKTLGDAKRPKVWIEIQERHVGQPTIDPAAETEFAAICSELGFTVIDRAKGAKSDADVILQGEGFSQFATRHGSLTSVKARLELKAVDRESSRVLAADRQVSIAVDGAELIASKEALQDAAAELASRLLPKIVGRR